ncbi:MAG: electron transfer flavoprotein subunit alpha [Actinobacteria bacterium]|nr:electron transfer flavoprotein subunit alpha [Actinomycetota bacterium]
MSDNIKVNIEKCNGCRRCVKVCNYNAITIVNGKAVIDLNLCTLCGACVDACKFNAITITKSAKKVDLSSYKGIWIVVENFDGELKNTSFQLISKAVQLAKVGKEDVTALLVGNKVMDSEKLKEIFSEYGVNKVIAIVNEALTRFNTEDFAEIISDEIMQSKPKILLFLGTIFGRTIAPRVATRVKTGITADCTDLQIDKKGNLVQIRPTYGGRVLAKIITPFNCPQMASVRPNVFVEEKLITKNKDVQVTVKKNDYRSKFTIMELKRVLQQIPWDRGLETPLDEAKIVYCAGLGVGSKEGFEMIKEFAQQCGATIAATREVVDHGWADFSQQIGQTGISIRPEIYVGFGVSGAIHHLIGMRNSRKIIAINKDPRAPIFKIADYCVIADLFDVVNKIKSIP